MRLLRYARNEVWNDCLRNQQVRFAVVCIFQFAIEVKKDSIAEISPSFFIAPV